MNLHSDSPFLTIRFTPFVRLWCCDVLRLQRVALGYTLEEVASLANGDLTDDAQLDDDDVAAVERGEVVPPPNVLRAIAGALWMEVVTDSNGEMRFSIEDLDMGPSTWDRVSAAVFSPDRLTVGEAEVREWRKRRQRW